MARSSIIGAKAHIARLKKLSGDQMVRDVGRALFAAGEMIAADAHVSITTSSSGGSNGGKHQHVPSRPGEPPNSDTGHLADNIETTHVAPLVVEVSSNAEYSAPLEWGSSKMDARPFMAPARDRNRKGAEQLVKQAVASVVRRSKSKE